MSFTIRGVWENFKGEPHNYGEIGLHFIRRVRQPPSINRETPVVVGTLVEEVNSIMLPDAKRRSLQAGANAYIDYGEDDGYELLVDTIAKLTRPR